MQKKILLIDDEDSTCSVMGRILQKAGYFVLLASSVSYAAISHWNFLL